jgi:hypothetical protein
MNQEILLKRETLAKEICAQLNNFVDLQNTLSLIIQQIKEMANVEAISIRLFEEGDYPYFVHEGFPESFIKAENSILSHKPMMPQTAMNLYSSIASVERLFAEMWIH